MVNTDKIKLALEKQLRELNQRAENIDDDLTAPGDDDWEEAASESAGDEVLEEVGDITLDEIAQIKNALVQIAAGRYGVCAACRENIEPKRLEALPYATKCIKCAE